MFTRVVEIKTKPGKAREVCQTVHGKILSTLKAQPGFVDEMVLVSDSEGILAMSIWKTREDADRYSREHYAEVNELIRHLVHSAPKVHTFDVETSTFHKIAKGIAA
ncbi:MAG TPA: antibiotic biosynthesis monooxygenase [Terriglobales bacterium]|jgi:heme-degrading monooxygenase HmoA|nr:antibiotic biosynthesis monooxygenase [Terriglobales bacterium]